ncbi:hypothetical protein [Helicobacter bilis]|uniref:Uncharacterized protein n=1 Tax=Helicobacter bilis TaxID=37372 RepID=A0A4V6I6B0_9HELI|nr:hypothetical protein [Helicobacter bilis]MCI7412080.1 hypothetical protein [Helicobacter bilis]MDD7297590.1 hypothetical protein [Helicobacter bilis]MDY4399288.1 hypothetical protein [Helicobacter bilis]TLE09755.1 hypothetical protein LS78_001715 [Helicobacter bilis]TLE12157.1 hypothetical protein LS79_000085 [Helicobacter bilis]
MDSHNNIKTKSFFLSLPFLFVLYVILCILGILAYRYFVTQAPLFEHTFVELISRGIILVFYLFVVNLPAFFLVFIPILRQNLIVFGVCLALVVAFSLTGLPATLSLSNQIFMIPWFVIWESFVVVSIVCDAFFRNMPKLNVSIVLVSSLKIIFGFCLGIVFFICCVVFQFYVFDRYDFIGRNYGIPYNKKVLFQDLGF